MNRRLHTLLSSAWMRLLLIAAGCTLLVMLLLPCIKPPFGVIFLGVALAALLCAIFIRKTWVSYITMICLPLFGVGSFMEFHLQAMRDPPPPLREEGNYKSTWNLEDPIRGYGPKPGPNASHSSKYQRDKLIYDITYTTDEQGRRVTPQHPDADTAVVFFGCSYTIGEGVQDTESYPWQTGALLGPKYQAFNYGFHGYGTHQFLAQLESGVLDDIAQKYPHMQVIFLNIKWHEMRAAGYSEWDNRGPRYVLENGKAVRKGHFDHWRDRNAFNQAIYQAPKDSMIYKQYFAWPSEAKQKELRALDRAVLQRASTYIAEHYPQATFTVAVYPNASVNVPELREAGLHVLDTAPFFPLPITDPSYSIPQEWHPTGKAYRALSEGMAKYIQSR